VACVGGEGREDGTFLSGNMQYIQLIRILIHLMANGEPRSAFSIMACLMTYTIDSTVGKVTGTSQRVHFAFGKLEHIIEVVTLHKKEAVNIH